MSESVLFVVPNLPYPLATGGHYRDWQIMNLLARAGTRPHMLYFGAGEGRTLESGSPVEPLCASIRYGGARVESPDGGLARTIARKLSYLTGFEAGSYPFSYQYDAIDSGRLILAAARDVRARTVVLRSFWCHHAPRLKAAGLRVIANCPDYNTKLAWEMVRSVRGLTGKIGPLCNYVGVRRQERRFLGQCDEVWVPTDEERRDLSATVRPEKLIVMPNLLDVASYPDFSADEGDGATMLFVANYGYAPNANAARLLIEEIFPAVRQRSPGARLILVGRGMPAALKAAASRLSGVDLVGFADDLRGYYRRTSLVLLPVREGAGMLYKTLEALSYGKACVGFRQAFRGLSGGDRPYASVDTTTEFIVRTTELLSDGARRRGLARRTRDYARSEVSWERGLRILGESTVSAC